MLLHLENLLIELYLPEYGMRSSMDKLFTDLEGRLDRKLRFMENLIQLQVAVGLILTCSNKDKEKSNKVEHIILPISGLVELHHLFYYI